LHIEKEGGLTETRPQIQRQAETLAQDPSRSLINSHLFRLATILRPQASAPPSHRRCHWKDVELARSIPARWSDPDVAGEGPEALGKGTSEHPDGHRTPGVHLVIIGSRGRSEFKLGEAASCRPSNLSLMVALVPMRIAFESATEDSVQLLQ
jgi:hypothetical protein